METPGEDVVVRSVESVLEGGPSKLTSCPNCGSDGVANYCASCGQRAGNLHTPIGAFVREALDGLLSFDSRVWRTLIVLLYRPGELTLEYWRGRRARYVAPLRLYLFVSFFTFLFLAFVAPRASSTPRAKIPTRWYESGSTKMTKMIRATWMTSVRTARLQCSGYSSSPV